MAACLSDAMIMSVEPDTGVVVEIPLVDVAFPVLIFLCLPSCTCNAQSSQSPYPSVGDKGRSLRTFLPSTCSFAFCGVNSSEVVARLLLLGMIRYLEYSEEYKRRDVLSSWCIKIFLEILWNTLETVIQLVRRATPKYPCYFFLYLIGIMSPTRFATARRPIDSHTLDVVIIDREK
ncbi:uncharacterized protein G2W53_018493 [Senna tora]|uniref:Uncharacterized protein n=1 Tax=Senna tora TaxID=362788 RepID=A0A834WRL7_9FABA|nr:uncharacterized protein G2W53_018493 [Senna tora]